MSEAENNRARPLGYITSVFPLLSHTFISREVLGLRRLGMDVRLFSLHRPDPDTLSAEDREFLHETFYVFPIRPIRFLARHLACLLKTPIRYLSLWCFALTRRESLRSKVRTFCHAAEAVYLAPEVRLAQVRHLHAHFASNAASVAMMLSRLTDIPFSFTAHGTGLLIEKHLLAEKIAAARFCVAVSEFNYRAIAATHASGAEKTCVVHCGLEPERFLPCHARHDSFNILTVGRLIDLKGHHYLIEACGLLRARGVEFQCRIVGEGPERNALEELIAERRLDGLVELVGSVPQEAIQEHYDWADLFALSSVSEGMPVVLMEAMAKAIPVVASRITGIPEMVADGENGYLTPPRDVEALAGAIQRLAGNPEQREAFGVRGRETILAEFDIRRNVAQLRDLFEETTMP